MKILFLAIPALFLCSCASKHIVAVRGPTGDPVNDAIMRIDYMSMNGPTFMASKQGEIIYHKGFFEPVQVIIESPTMGSRIFEYPPPGIVILDGKYWRKSLKITEPDVQQNSAPNPSGPVR